MPRKKNSAHTNNNQVRILAGQWRGRPVAFPSIDNLRPTGSRIRETLFNWLQPHIAQATCLDLFSGSGILSFEALSRGAQQAVAIDHASPVIQQLHQQAAIFNTKNLYPLQHSASAFIQKKPTDWQHQYPWIKSEGYSIIFLDPPFQEDVLTQLSQQLSTHHWLTKNALIYLEKNKHQTFIPPIDWILLKDKIAGTVSYQLYQTNAEPPPTATTSASIIA